MELTSERPVSIGLRTQKHRGSETVLTSVNRYCFVCGSASVLLSSVVERSVCSSCTKDRCNSANCPFTRHAMADCPMIERREFARPWRRWRARVGRRLSQAGLSRLFLPRKASELHADYALRRRHRIKHQPIPISIKPTADGSGTAAAASPPLGPSS